MKTNPICIKCGTDLNEENWYSSQRKGNRRICKECETERVRQWQKANPEKVKAIWTRRNRKRGHRPFNENKTSPLYLGVHVAERVLSHVFKDVERMPHNNPGFDFICNCGKKVDVKSSCITKDGRWAFNITHNTTADYFLCLAFDNREDLNPLHAWMIPGGKVSHLISATIRLSTIDRWNEHKLDLAKISTCCEAIRG